MTKTKPENMEVQIYKNKEGSVSIDVRLKGDTVWLTQAQIANLFKVERSVITKHINKVFVTGELLEKSNVQKMHITGVDKPSKIYSLDMVISVGYRVNSKQATDFRIWATKILKSYLIKGYSLNQKLLLSQRNKFKDLQETIGFVENKSHQNLLSNQGSELLSIIKQYTKSLDLLKQYDTEKIKKVKGSTPIYKLHISDTLETIKNIKNNLQKTKKNLGYFGIESSDRLSGIVGNLSQTYGGKELYESTEEKAANLLYLVIKDHPFIDGNKRIGSLLFINYLDKNRVLYRDTGERKINDNALVALALLVAISNPTEKKILIKVIISLIS